MGVGRVAVFCVYVFFVKKKKKTEFSNNNNKHDQNSGALRNRGIWFKQEHVRAPDLPQRCSYTPGLHHCRPAWRFAPWCCGASLPNPAN